MGNCIIFSNFLGVMFMNHKYEALWSLKNYKLYTLCTLILSNPSHLTIASRLILNFEFQNVVVQILKFFVCI
jgi:hypothetical protein